MIFVIDNFLKLDFVERKLNGLRMGYFVEKYFFMLKLVY